MHIDSLAIVGVGLIGGSIGLAARRRGLARQVIGVGRDHVLLRRAVELGAIDSVVIDMAAAARSADLIVVCTPVDRIVPQVLAAASSCRPGTLITDAGSTKAVIVRDLEGKLPAGVHFVGSHPLAGSEKRGVEHAGADLFEGRVAVVTPVPSTDPSAVERVSGFWRALGSDVRTLEPEMHDRALALTSHLPHLAAAALAGIVPQRDLPFAATGFRDTTRVASGDPALWTAIFRQNALAMCDAMQRLTERLEAFRHAIVNDDDAALLELLTQGKRVRDALGS